MTTSPCPLPAEAASAGQPAGRPRRPAVQPLCLRGHGRLWPGDPARRPAAGAELELWGARRGCASGSTLARRPTGGRARAARTARRDRPRAAYRRRPPWARLPLHPRLARLVVRAAETGVPRLARNRGGAFGRNVARAADGHDARWRDPETASTLCGAARRGARRPAHAVALGARRERPSSSRGAGERTRGRGDARGNARAPAARRVSDWLARLRAGKRNATCSPTGAARLSPASCVAGAS
jgi:hypothetical protein